ncbi:MAG: hypothetical protein ABIS01_03845, partial [Ferruginibacter sp.]
MEIYILLFIAGLVIGLLIAFTIRAASKQQLLNAKELMQQEHQAVLQLQQEKVQQQKDREDLLSRAVEAEGANKFLQQETVQYHQL